LACCFECFRATPMQHGMLLCLIGRTRVHAAVHAARKMSPDQCAVLQAGRWLRQSGAPSSAARSRAAAGAHLHQTPRQDRRRGRQRQARMASRPETQLESSTRPASRRLRGCRTWATPASSTRRCRCGAMPLNGQQMRERLCTLCVKPATPSCDAARATDSCPFSEWVPIAQVLAAAPAVQRCYGSPEQLGRQAALGSAMREVMQATSGEANKKPLFGYAQQPGGHSSPSRSQGTQRLPS
jgi:hypothetical protein